MSADLTDSIYTIVDIYKPLDTILQSGVSLSTQ